MTEMLGFLGLALMLAAAPVQLCVLLKASRSQTVIVFLVSFAAVLIPWSAHSLIYYLRGVMGDLSFVGFILLIIFHSQALGVSRYPIKPLSWPAGLLLLCLLAPLYASALGYWTYDLYAWGYHPQGMLMGMGALLVWSWHMQPQLAIAWLLGITAFACGLCPSANFWDALFDPFMLIAAIAVVLKSATLALIRNRSLHSIQYPSQYKQAA